MTFRKTMTQEARDEGIEIGISQGISQGIEKGQREFFLKQCLEKFKQIAPDEMRRQIEMLNMTQLDELSRKILYAQNPKELGLID